MPRAAEIGIYTPQVDDSNVTGKIFKGWSTDAKADSSNLLIEEPTQSAGTTGNGGTTTGGGSTSQSTRLCDIIGAAQKKIGEGAKDNEYVITLYAIYADAYTITNSGTFTVSDAVHLLNYGTVTNTATTSQFANQTAYDGAAFYTKTEAAGTSVTLDTGATTKGVKIGSAATVYGTFKYATTKTAAGTYNSAATITGTDSVGQGKKIVLTYFGGLQAAEDIA